MRDSDRSRSDNDSRRSCEHLQAGLAKLTVGAGNGGRPEVQIGAGFAAAAYEPLVCELREQRPQCLLVHAPTAYRAIVDRLAHLRRTRGENRPFRLMESQTARIPV
jgi:hypothetical protein